MNATDVQANGGDGQVTALLSALTQAFSVIVLGYVCALSGFVSPDAARGIGQLVGKIALPCLLFRAVATTDLATVNLMVVLVVILAKYLCLTVAALVGYFKNREQKENLTIAGTFALFVTNSNDLAIGVPLVNALYPTCPNAGCIPNGPNVSYVYVFAVMQNILVAPTVFAILELGAAKAKKGEKENQGNAGSVIGNVLRSLIRNPLIVMAMLGLIYNFSFGTDLPSTIDMTLVLIKNAFACGALFTTGMGSVGQTSAMSGKGFIIPVFLSLTKSLLMPVIARYLSVLILEKSLDPTIFNTFTNFIFLYAAIPTAASTPVICQQFVGHLTHLIQLMTGATVLNLLVSAPLMVLATVVFGIQGLDKYCNTLANYFTAGAAGSLPLTLLLRRGPATPSNAFSTDERMTRIATVDRLTPVGKQLARNCRQVISTKSKI
jgi:predicted permease